MNTQLLLTLIYILSMATAMYYFIRIDKENDLEPDKINALFILLPGVNTFYAVSFLIIDFRWILLNAFIMVKYFVIKRVDKWAIKRYVQIQSRLIKYYGVDQYRKVINDTIDEAIKTQ